MSTFDTEQINDYVRASSISEKDKEDFIALLKTRQNEGLATTLEIFKEDPSMVEKMYSNYKEKVTAFKANDTEQLDRILAVEKKMLEQ